MNDRDALAALIVKQGLPARYSLQLHEAEDLADAILAAGWRAPAPASGRADPSHQHTWWEDNGNAGCNCGATLRP